LSCVSVVMIIAFPGMETSDISIQRDRTVTKG
jgi:hypothetical protein